MVLTKIPKHIEIVRSTTMSLSSMSQKSCDAIYNLLKRHYAEVGVTTVNNLADLEVLASKQPDLAFLGMQFVPLNPALGSRDSNKIWISSYLDEHGIAYTGSRQEAHELERNKPLAKQRVLDADLKTSPFYVHKQNQLQARKDVPLTFPLFIKPTNRGGGLGIDSNSVAHAADALHAKVQSIATRFRSDSLVEEYLPGREFSVAILKDEDLALGKLAAMPIELVAQPDEQGARFLSGQVKSSNTELVLEVTDETIKAKVIGLAVSVFNALGARDYGRIDIRLDQFGTPHFLEANLLPSLISGYGSFPKACVLNKGLDYESMILHIVRLGLAHTVIFTEHMQEANPVIYSPTVAPVAI